MTTPDAGRTPRRDWLTFDRSDRWGLAGLLLLAALAALVGWVVGPLVDWAEGRALPLEVFSEVSVPALDATGVSHGLGSYDVYLEDPTAGQRLLSLLPGLLWLGLVVTGCLLVFRVMRSIAAGDPFEPANVRRLRILAGVLVLGAPVAFFTELSIQGGLIGQVDLGALAPGFTFSPPWLAMIGGMVVALLAEAFKAGSRLREDVEGLV